jgi:uncharacterized membrane protein YeaQ/YmgE (transglycosylase-associated protein family)
MVPDSVRRRIDVPKRLVVRNARTISDTRYQAVRSSPDLEKRISNLERLVGFLTDMLLGLTSACFAIAGAAYFGGGLHLEQTIAVAVLAALIAMWVANFLFPKMKRWGFE